MSFIVLNSADISSVSSFDLLLFIACYYANVIRRPSLFTLKGFSVFGMYTGTFLFPYGVHFMYAISKLGLFLHIQVGAKKKTTL